MASDADDLATRLKRIHDLAERLGSEQANSVEAHDLFARVQRETFELNRVLASTAKNRK